jgi:hypothetical protein
LNIFIHPKQKLISLLEILLSVKTFQWLVDVLRMPRVETCQHTFCVNVKLGLRVTERSNVQVNRIFGSDDVILSNEHSVMLC